MDKVPSRHTHLRGTARLATDGAAGLTDLVEALHERIARLPGVAPPKTAGRTKGITGLVYKTVRGITRGVGDSLEVLLGLLAPALGQDDDPIPEREALIAALNGTLGDYLVASENPLATLMALRRTGRTLLLDAPSLAADRQDESGRILVLIHGLCMNDLQWTRAGHDHGAALARDLGFTPVYLRYNSGLHVSTNGRALARHLEQLIDSWPHPVQRLALLGHSMGGLLARSAWHYGTQAGHRWTRCLSDLVFLGTPHHGAPLERAGHWVDLVLSATPYAAPFARLGKLRSAGITDLRHGNLLDEDWAGRDRFAFGPDRRQPAPLPTEVRCYAVAASIGRKAGNLKDRLLGDGLVPLDSALGRHRDPARSLTFTEDRQWVGYGINHLDLLADAAVWAQLRRWLGPAPSTLEL